MLLCVYVSRRCAVFLILFHVVKLISRMENVYANEFLHREWVELPIHTDTQKGNIEQHITSSPFFVILFEVNMYHFSLEKDEINQSIYSHISHPTRLFSNQTDLREEEEWRPKITFFHLVSRSVSLSIFVPFDIHPAALSYDLLYPIHLQSI